MDRYHRDGGYTAAFYDKIDEGSARSARRVVPVVIADFAPATVVDVGCGAGSWGEVFWALGADVTGVDGPYVPVERRRITEFVEWDLTRPLPSLGRFDLAVSLEVAEHLPATCSDRFVAGLCSLADRVLFSAAVPGQGGDGHVNEQPHQYWIDRFASHGLLADEAWRARFDDDDAVAWWYRQNMLVFERTA